MLYCLPEVCGDLWSLRYSWSRTEHKSCKAIGLSPSWRGRKTSGTARCGEIKWIKWINWQCFFFGQTLKSFPSKPKFWSTFFPSKLWIWFYELYPKRVKTSYLRISWFVLDLFMASLCWTSAQIGLASSYIARPVKRSRGHASSSLVKPWNLVGCVLSRQEHRHEAETKKKKQCKC